MAVGKLDDRGQEGVHVFLTYRINVPPEEIVRRYTGRWRIENVFKELKDFLHIDQCRVRNPKAVQHTWHLALLARTYLAGPAAGGPRAQLQAPHSVSRRPGRCTAAPTATRRSVGSAAISTSSVSSG